MTVRELRTLLEQYPDDLPVAFQLYSEYAEMNAEHIEQRELFDNGGYLSSLYRDADAPKLRAYLVFPGN